MDPAVRYTRTSDDVDVAYWVMGDGPVLVQGPLVPYSHIEMEWQIPELRAWYLALAEGRTLVRYDNRGSGLSTREPADVSLDGHVRDLESVVMAIGRPATVLGVFHSGLAAITLAASRPDLVAGLILWATFSRGADYWKAAQAEGLRALRTTDYELFLRTGAHELLGWAQGEEADRFAEVMRAATSPETADALIAGTRDFDVEAHLAAISCPTLVVHRRDLTWLDISLSRRLASSIGGASLAVIEGSSPLPGAGTGGVVPPAVADFLGIAGGADRREGALQTVLFTDIADHTRLMAATGDAAGRHILRSIEEITRAALRAHGGREIKALGDGVMAAFPAVTSALECAVDIQKRLAEWQGSGDAPSAAVSVRIGLSAGEPIQEDGDLYGSSVILASRITGQAAGGEILVANTVRDLAVGKDFRFEDRGEFVPKGFDEPLRIWRLAW